MFRGEIIDPVREEGTMTTISLKQIIHVDKKPFSWRHTIRLGYRSSWSRRVTSFLDFSSISWSPPPKTANTSKSRWSISAWFIPQEIAQRYIMNKLQLQIKCNFEHWETYEWIRLGGSGGAPNTEDWIGRDWSLYRYYTDIRYNLFLGFTRTCDSDPILLFKQSISNPGFSIFDTFLVGLNLYHNKLGNYKN